MATAQQLSQVTLSTLTPAQCGPLTVSWVNGVPPLRLSVYSQQTPNVSSFFPIPSLFFNLESTNSFSASTSSPSGAISNVVLGSMGGYATVQTIADSGTGVYVEIVDHAGVLAQSQTVAVVAPGSRGCMPSTGTKSGPYAGVAFGLAAVSFLLIIALAYLTFRVRRLKRRLRDALTSAINLPDSPDSATGTRGVTTVGVVRTPRPQRAYSGAASERYIAQELHEMEVERLMGLGVGLANGLASAGEADEKARYRRQMNATYPMHRSSSSLASDVYSFDSTNRPRLPSAASRRDSDYQTRPRQASVHSMTMGNMPAYSPPQNGSSPLPQPGVQSPASPPQDRERSLHRRAATNSSSMVADPVPSYYGPSGGGRFSPEQKEHHQRESLLKLTTSPNGQGYASPWKQDEGPEVCVDSPSSKGASPVSHLVASPLSPPQGGGTLPLPAPEQGTETARSSGVWSVEWRKGDDGARLSAASSTAADQGSTEGGGGGGGKRSNETVRGSGGSAGGGSGGGHAVSSEEGTLESDEFWRTRRRKKRAERCSDASQKPPEGLKDAEGGSSTTVPAAEGSRGA